MELLLRASELTGEDRHLDSAKRLGDFLLRAQLPAPQRGWAQQYDENMHPAWARKFEPPSLCSNESYGAIEALFALWLATGEDRYRETLPAALDWLESSRLDNGGWARFYEMRTNRPLYCEAETYRVTYDDSNLPTHYGFQIDEGFGRKLERMREQIDRPREESLRRIRPPDSPENWRKAARSLEGKVRDALRTQHSDGYWMRDDRVDAREFVRRMTVVADYVEAVRRGGDSGR
jgi:hypothetical protein